MSNAELPAVKVSVLIFVLAISLSAITRKTTVRNEQHPKRHCEVESIFLTGTANMAAPMVVVLHGDAPFVNRRYQYAFASNLAGAVPGTRVFTVFRPGSADPNEAKLGVERAVAFRDSYRLEVVDDIARAIESLKARWNAPGVILVGDESGAAAAAYVAALHPDLVQSAVLILCPCEIPALTFHRTLLTVHSVSPLQALDQMSKRTKVTAIAGTNDSMRKEIASSYVAKAAALGISASLVLIPTRGRGFLNDPILIKDIARAIHNN
jgi:hypothetical protein